MTPLTNWAGNLTYQAARVHHPHDVSELQTLVARTPKLRVLGTRHSFNTIADTTADLISLERLDRIIALDETNRTVTIEGGVRYGELCQYLDAAGYALHNTASLPHISVAGACATATHGSGVNNGNLATAVTSMDFVAADGTLHTISGDALSGAVVHLGCLGVVARLTLAVEPAYTMRQVLYTPFALDQAEAHVDNMMQRAYSVSIFTDWRNAARTQVLLKERIDLAHAPDIEPELFGAPRALVTRHPIPEMPAENCTEQCGVVGPWHARLPHFRLDATPSAGAELQSEYFVPMGNARAALQGLRQLGDVLSGVLMISEVRTIAADALWLSPAYQRASVGLHFTWFPDWAAVQAVLPQVEAVLLPLGARPHWGKVFTLDAATVRVAYPRLPDFQRLVQHYDPHGKFQNAFVSKYIV